MRSIESGLLLLPPGSTDQLLPLVAMRVKCRAPGKCFSDSISIYNLMIILKKMRAASTIEMIIYSTDEKFSIPPVKDIHQTHHYIFLQK